MNFSLLSQDPKKIKALYCLLGACLIWGGWWVINRYGALSGMGSYDTIALRFGVAGILLLPVLARLGPGTTWPRAIIVGLLGGALNSLCAISGVQFASATHGAVLMPGMVPIFTALLAWLILNEAIARTRWLGIVILIFGAFLIGARDFGGSSEQEWIGHLLFLGSSICWSAYTVLMRKWKINAWQGTALAAVVSMVIYLPIYSFIFGARVFDHPMGDIALQAVYQGIVASIGAVVLFNSAIAVLGATGAGASGALIPVFTLILAAIFLHEIPNAFELCGVLAVAIGLPFAMGILGNKSAIVVEDDVTREESRGHKLDVTA